MTLRHKLADWLSGGALTEAEAAIAAWKRESNDGWTVAICRLAALQSIISCENPGANATVRRMARIAREAIK